MVDRMNRGATFFGAVAAACSAGALGGALIGVAESVLVATTSAAAKEYWLFLFGAVSYGLLGAALGLGVGVAWQLLHRGRSTPLAAAQLAVACAVALPALAVGRYHVSQRIFREGLVLLSLQGLVSHLLLVIGAALFALLGIALVRLCHRLGGVAGVAGALAAVLLLGLIVGATAGESGASTVNRRSPAATAAGKPNVILVVVDTLRADAVEGGAAKGNSGFARLAEDGVTFERAYSQSSWTRPSIATILTAQYPSVHGAVHKMDFLPDRVHTLAEELRGAGYFTAAYTTNINIAPVFNFSQGFDEFTYLEPSFYFGATDSSTTLAIYKGLRVARERFFSSRMYFQHYYQDAEVVGRHVGGWLDSRPPEPFFLFVHYMDPHDPYFEVPYNGHGVARVMTPSPPANQAEALHELYLQDVRYLDGHLHALLERLRSSGLYDRSVIALTADHGEEFHDHGGWWHGTTLYQEQVHVPLIIKRPGEAERGTRRAAIARSLDIGPTLVAATASKIPESFMGVDLFGPGANEPLLAEEDLEGNQLSSIRAGDWKLISANPGNPRGLAPVELYNLADDPEEKKNLAAKETRRVDDLLAQLESLRARFAATGQRLIGQRKSDAVDPRA